MATAIIATVRAGFAPTYYLKPLFATPALPLSMPQRTEPISTDGLV
jgi:hypothetical protein